MVSLTPEMIDVSTLLKSRAPLMVPRYQRGYAWEKQHLRDFVNDIRKLNTEQLDEHFLGSILTVRRHQPGATKDTALEIVDGQQRTTTLVLALHAIYRGLTTLAQQSEAEGDVAGANLTRESAEDLRREYLVWKDDLASPPEMRPRLTLSVDDHSYFWSLISHDELPDPVRESHILLRDAHSTLYDQLVGSVVAASSTPATERANELRKLRDSIVKKAKLLNLSTDNKKSAYRLFTILNNRGKALSEADLLRTRTLELLDANAAALQDADKEWSSIMKHNSKAVVQFLRQLYSSRVGERPPSNNFFDAVQNHFKLAEPSNDSREIKRVSALVGDISAESEIYWMLNRAKWPYSRRASGVSAWKQDRLARLVKVLRHKASLPVLMSAADALDQKQFVEVVGLLERFIFRYVTICKGHASSLADELYREAARIRNAKADYDISSMVKLTSKLSTEHAPDHVFRAVLFERLQYNRKNSLIIKHFLTTLEDFKEAAWTPGAAPTFDTAYTFDLDEMHVEHIYPQNPKRMDTALHPIRDRIGNLTFWHPEDNTGAQNALFDTKRKLYKKSKIQMTKTLADYSDWTEEVMREREAALLESAMKVWGIQKKA